jgi:hypothetical protein
MRNLDGATGFLRQHAGARLYTLGSDNYPIEDFLLGKIELF